MKPGLFEANWDFPLTLVRVTCREQIFTGVSDL